jgi:hypothetical protein
MLMRRSLAEKMTTVICFESAAYENGKPCSWNG